MKALTKRHVADVLYAFRFAGAFDVGALIVVGLWGIALPLFAVIVVCNPLQCCLPKSNMQRKPGAWMNDTAAGMLLIVVPMAIIARLALATYNQFPDANGVMMWIWLGGSFGAFWLPGAFNLRKMYLWAAQARFTDKLQGWTYLLILAGAATQINYSAHGTSAASWVWLAAGGVIVAAMAVPTIRRRPVAHGPFEGHRSSIISEDLA